MATATCQKCGHTWRTRVANPPRCKACGTRRWAGNKQAATSARVATARVQLRAVIDDAVGAFDCLPCGHSWTGPRYRRCPACDRLRWWQPLRVTHAQRRTRERDEMHQAARDRVQENARPPLLAVRHAPQPNGDVWISWTNRDTGEDGFYVALWADLFEEADAEYEAGVLAEHRAAVAAAEDDERARVDAAQVVEREREEQAAREREATKERQRSRAEWQRQEAQREEREAAAEAERQRRAHHAAQRAEAARLEQEWLHAHWYRPLARVLGSVLYASVVPVFYLIVLAVVTAGVLFAVHQIKPHWDSWRTASEPTAVIATPTPREEDYLAAHQHALEQVEEWKLRIEMRIERDRPLPNGLDLADARAQLAYWEERADGFASALQRYQ